MDIDAAKSNLRALEIRKATMLANLQMLSEISEKAYTDFGKICFKVAEAKRKVNQLTPNLINEN